VVVDTGSSWLTIKSCLSAAQCHFREVGLRNKTTGKKAIHPKTGKHWKIWKPDITYHSNTSISSTLTNN
jgi:hypothetical protein